MKTRFRLEYDRHHHHHYLGTHLRGCQSRCRRRRRYATSGGGKLRNKLRASRRHDLSAAVSRQEAAYWTWRGKQHLEVFVPAPGEWLGGESPERVATVCTQIALVAASGSRPGVDKPV